MGKEGRKNLVAYFSVTGTTKNFAQMIASLVNGDLFEIKPTEKYQEDDLDWQNPNSRTCKEKNDPSCRPQLSKLVKNFSQYETIFIGFPIWWFTAPKVINTFLDSYDFTGKKIVPFITSFGSTSDIAEADLKAACQFKAIWSSARRFGSVDADILTVKDWIDTLGI